MKFLVIIAALLVSVNCQLPNDAKRINPPNCGKRLSDFTGETTEKIVGGQSAIVGDWGWQVSMNYSGRLSCGGSIINSQWVLTAAHCVSSLSPTPYSYDIGHHDRAILEPWAQTRRVSLVVRHPAYQSFNFRNDVALMKLDRPVSYVNQIVPVCIPNGQVSYPGRDSWATGWGTLSSGGYISRYLQEVKMPFLTDERCKQKVGSMIDTPTMVCAGEVGENKDTCQGDSGGPLVIKHLPTDPSSDVYDDEANNGQPANRWYSVGVTSWGYGCGDGGAYARTTQYYQWIKDTIRAN